MFCIIIGLLFKDKVFEAALQRGIIESSLSTVVKILEYKDDFIADQDSDVILMDNDYYELIKNEKNNKFLIKKSILLCTETNKDMTKDCEIKLIDKYSGVKNIINSINEKYFSLKGKNRISNLTNESRILSFCATVGGSGVTASALEVARQLAHFENKKVIYINAESIDSSRNYIPIDSQCDIRKLFLEMSIFKDKEYNYPIDKYIGEYNDFYYLKNSRYENFLANKPDNLLEVIKLLNIQKKFDYIIVDFGKEVKNVWTELINQSDNIFFIKNMNGYETKMNKKIIEKYDKNKLHFFLPIGEKSIDCNKNETDRDFLSIDPLSPFAANIKKLVKTIVSTRSEDNNG